MTQTVELTPTLVLGLYRPIHDKIRDALEGLDQTALDWRPGPETNSIGALVQHIAWTERGNIARITGAHMAAGAFAWDETGTLDQVALRRILDEADAFLDEMAATLPQSSFSMQVVHPHRGPSTALVLLLQTYGHVYEHYGHLELTRQLYLQGVAG